MKKVKFLTISIFAIALFASCSDDDVPEPVNEEEVITTLTVTLDSGSGSVVMQYQDLDGDGPDAGTVTVSGPLSANTSYDGSIVLLNETEDPAENVTEEIEEEDLDHQFFYTVGSGLDVTTEYTSFDSAGNELGLTFELNTAGASSGGLTFTLRHEPNKPNTGLADAGGETDIEVTFSVAVVD
ncbi:MAG: type 1 periplasmic binding fold superfamily protein [Flavobacteriaceae bacterium]|jgi:hypothetical protein|nr:type 1 periplasmic binding fold superfamily protein [Flavobacteriaceae bacterium]MBT3919100.1 type 1 periplasmic binding fold superfamily protein [Flavobacteriaceae bacterium]MBT6705483.1 type 1 periplasmic binding fold superfamily protein [Flavobacteriaceae bacterium]